jgi:U3 small nucleolar RNA-associated protein 7
MAIDRGGHYMATAGADARMNIFDIRTYKEVHSYFTPTPASSLQISDTGLLAVGWGSHVTLWKDALRQKQKDPYMAHHQEGSAITGMKFCPYDDILGTGHESGFSSLIVPGAGEANFDALEANPYATKKQKQEAEVKRLLEKLRPEMIALDPEFVGRVDRHAALQQSAEIAEKEKEKALMEKLKSEEKNRMRGKNSSLRKALRKKGNIIDYRRLKLEKIKSDRKRRAEAQKRGETEEEETGSKALQRFKKPKQR